MNEADQRGPHRAAKARASRWGRVAALSGALFIASYVLGVFFMMRLENEYHTCTQARFGVPDGSGLPLFIRLEDRFLPPSAECRWEDGSSLDLVPSFVAPLLLIFLVVAAVAAVAAVIQRRKGTTG